MRRFAADLARGARRLERWLLPSACLLCREPVPATSGDALVCPLCRGRWRAVVPPWCDRCGQATGADDACRLCVPWPRELRRVRSAVWLGESSRLAVHHLKYGGWWRVADDLAAAMRGLDPLRDDGAVLVPIPLAARRLRRRGYNQSERLARALGASLGLEVRTDLLRRARETVTQTSLPPEARWANVEGAFLASGLPDTRLVLVDDVFTTGATLAAAASALANRSAARVEAVTFARAPDLAGEGVASPATSHSHLSRGAFA